MSMVFKAKIKRAREILGKPFVTDVDIQHLEAEGKLASLDVSPQDTTATAKLERPAYLPK